jgi:hypothetical protein
MAFDNKYGKVTLEHGTVGEDEPVVVFRARDELLPKVLQFYKELCEAEGSPQRHLELIDQTMTDVVWWQSENGTKIPDSEASREWLGE